MLIFFGHKQAPLQGMILMDGQSVLASRARPAVILIPNNMHLERCGWKTVRPKDRRLESENVRVSLAEYRSANAQMICALAETSGEVEWEAPHHVPYPTLRVHDEPYGKERLYESLFLLDPGNDPFSGERVLVMRAKFLLFFQKMQAIIEYREPVSNADARTIDLNSQALKAFVERAHASFTVLFPGDDEKKTVFAGIEKLAPMDGISREKLAAWLGEVKHPGHGR